MRGDKIIRIQRGLDIPLLGEPEQKIYPASQVTSVAVIGSDYMGMKPAMAVRVNDRVKKGQVLFTCKKQGGVPYTAPGAGVVKAIHRGDKRVFESLVIELDEREQAVSFPLISDFSTARKDEVEKTLLHSGLWNSFRTRPYSKCPLPGTSAHSIFVTAMDTHPLAADYEFIFQEGDNLASFYHGLKALSCLTEGKLYICVGAKSQIVCPQELGERAEKVIFIGPHPAGNGGTHMHFLDPVGEHKINWNIHAQDVMAIGKLFLTGELWVERVISLAGPQVKRPRLIKTRLGANLDQIMTGELKSPVGSGSRVISGSALYGRQCTGHFSYLGRFSRQVTVLEEGGEREFLGWQSPGFDKYSAKPIYLSALNRAKKFPLTTTTNGSPRAIVPIGMYEKVMPLDILPTPLLRALCSQDTQSAQELGALELDEEDLALCTFVDPGKTDFAPLLRSNLEIIERGG